MKTIDTVLENSEITIDLMPGCKTLINNGTGLGDKRGYGLCETLAYDVTGMAIVQDDVMAGIRVSGSSVGVANAIAYDDVMAGIRAEPTGTSPIKLIDENHGGMYRDGHKFDGHKVIGNSPEKMSLHYH